MRGWWEGKRECWRSKGAELLEEMTIAQGVGRWEWVGGELLQNIERKDFEKVNKIQL